MLCLSDGQQIATRLSRQITKVTNKMKLTMEKCNAATDSLRDYINGLPKRITFDKISDPTSELFLDLDTNETCYPVEASTKVPLYTKRKAIELHLFLKRCKEEEQLLVVERERLLSYYTKTCCKIDEKLASIADLSGSHHRFSFGSKHELLRMRARLLKRHILSSLIFPGGLKALVDKLMDVFTYFYMIDLGVLCICAKCVYAGKISF